MFLATVIISVTGCTDLPQLVLAPAKDQDICGAAATAAHLRAGEAEIGGWLLGILGFAAATAGSTIIPLASDKLTPRWKVLAASLTGSGVILVALMQTAFSSHKEAALLASELDDVVADYQDPAVGSDKAGSADQWLFILSRDKGTTVTRAFGKCARALAAWEKSRADDGDFATAMLSQEKEQNSVSHKEANEANTRADVAVDTLHALQKASVLECKDGHCSDTFTAQVNKLYKSDALGVFSADWPFVFAPSGSDSQTPLGQGTDGASGSGSATQSGGTSSQRPSANKK